MKTLLTLAAELATRKTTARRIAKDGTFPLSTTLDSIGPIAPGVACCALVDSVLAGDAPQVPPPLPPNEAPVGLMVVGQSGEDRRLLAVGLALESALRQ